MHSDLESFFSQYGPISKEVLDALMLKFRKQSLQKQDLLLAPGQVCERLYFVSSGCLRLYYTADEVDTTVWFSLENNSAIELSSFISGAPSEYFLEAIEPSEVLVLQKHDLDEICESYPAMHRVLRSFWEDVILNLLKRFTALQKDSAEKRYLDLMKQPQYLQRIPQKYLASYIGVTPTSLSRIRRNIK